MFIAAGKRIFECLVTFKQNREEYKEYSVALSLIYTVFLIAFFANSLVGYNLIPPDVTIATELVIYWLFLYSLVVRRANHQSYDFHLLPIFGFFLVVAFCSIVVNHVFNFRSILSLRLILRFYFFYLAVINLGLTENQFKKINTLLFILFIIQLPASAIKFCFYGVSELTMGTYGVRGGGLTTNIPIIALGYLAGYHAFHKARSVYFLLGIGFILYGIVGAKAALFFLLPITFFGLYYLTYIRGKNVDVGRHVFVLVMILLFSVVVTGTIIKFNQRLNAQRGVGGEIDFFYALKYSQKYTSGINPLDPDVGSGRFSTTMLTFDTAWKGGLPHFCFGYGPGCLTGSILSKRPSATRGPTSGISQSYGKTGMVFILAEYGLLGLIPLVLMFCMFAHMCWKWYNSEKEPYWKAFAVGSLVFAFSEMFMFFAYNAGPIMGDTIMPVYFYAMATMYLRLKQIARGCVNNNSNIA